MPSNVEIPVDAFDDNNFNEDSNGSLVNSSNICICCSKILDNINLGSEKTADEEVDGKTLKTL